MYPVVFTHLVLSFLFSLSLSPFSCLFFLFLSLFTTPFSLPFPYSCSFEVWSRLLVFPAELVGAPAVIDSDAFKRTKTAWGEYSNGMDADYTVVASNDSELPLDIRRVVVVATCDIFH